MKKRLKPDIVVERRVMHKDGSFHVKGPPKRRKHKNSPEYLNMEKFAGKSDLPKDDGDIEGVLQAPTRIFPRAPRSGRFEREAIALRAKALKGIK